MKSVHLYEYKLRWRRIMKFVSFFLFFTDHWTQYIIMPVSFMMQWCAYTNYYITFCQFQNFNTDSVGIVWMPNANALLHFIYFYPKGTRNQEVVQIFMSKTQFKYFFFGIFLMLLNSIRMSVTGYQCQRCCSFLCV